MSISLLLNSQNCHAKKHCDEHAVESYKIRIV